MDSPRKRRSRLFVVLLLLVALVVWFYFRPAQHAGLSAAEVEADRIAEIGMDPDDILVDLADDADDEDVAAIEKSLGIDLVLVSDESLDERFYRAHVDPMRQDAILEALSKHELVEIAEPDALYQLDPSAMVEVPASDVQWADFPNDPQYKFQWHMGQINMPAA